MFFFILSLVFIQFHWYGADDALEKIREFDRKNRIIFIGSCAPAPLHEIIFLLTQDFPDVSINSELKDDQYLISSLQNDLFNLAILHERPNDENFFSLKCGGEKVLLYSKIGFWYHQGAWNPIFWMGSLIALAGVAIQSTGMS